MSATATTLELIVWHFIREKYEDKFKKINVPLSLKYLIKNFSKNVIDSKILTINEDTSLIKLLLSKISNITQIRFKLLYRASDHKFSAYKFHELCDNHAPTICIIQSECGNIFGGYSSVGWSPKSIYFGAQGYIEDNKAFLFLLRSSNQSEKVPVLFECNQPHQALYYASYLGPIFGRWHDICIHNGSNTQCRGNITVNSYECKPGQLCTGNFNVIQYELFQLLHSV